jgi:hypothetical protein
MRTILVTWMDGQQRKFDMDSYSVHDEVIWIIVRNRKPVLIPVRNVRIVEEEE